MFSDIIHNLSTFKNRFPLLFELVPPDLQNRESRIRQHTGYLEQLFQEVDVDALNIPEIQNESGKSEKGTKRTPFKRRVPPRNYARKLSERFDAEFVINRVSVKHKPDQLERWMLETSLEYDINTIVIVGGESSRIQYEGPSVTTGNRIAKRYLNRGKFKYDKGEFEPAKFTIGNICIPTRRRDDYDEPERMLNKLKAGADFFTSQIITEPETPVSLMKDFSELLEKEEMEPPMIFWSFSPISSQTDVDFMRWLGVRIPEKTENLILGRGNPAAVSADHFQTVWEKMLDFNQQLPVSFPMGINISVMGLRNFENGIELAKELNMAGVPD